MYIFVYSLLPCGDFGGVSCCLANVHVCAYIRVFPAELAVQNVVDFFVSNYHELVGTIFIYLLFGVMSIFKGFVVTLRVLPTAFYTPPFHVYMFVYSRFSWSDSGGTFSCLTHCAYVRVFPAEHAVQNVVASPISVRLLCKYPSRIGSITFNCLLTSCPRLRVTLFVVTLHFCPF